MLGRLARWLRALGYDTAYEADVEDDELVRRAFEEGRGVPALPLCDRIYWEGSHTRRLRRVLALAFEDDR